MLVNDDLITSICVNLKYGHLLYFAVVLLLSPEPVPKTTGFSLVKGALLGRWFTSISSCSVRPSSINHIDLYDYIRLSMCLFILVRFGFYEFGFYSTPLRFGILVYRATGYQNHCT